VKRMLTQNRELREDNVWSWTLPAAKIRLTDGTWFNVCPHADACVNVCYARQGTYIFPKVRAAHVRNLEWTLDDLDGWAEAMTVELSHKRFRPTGTPRVGAFPEGDTPDPLLARWAGAGGAAVRIHDAGDFYSDEYLSAWKQIAAATPDVLFYAYTKEVTLVRSNSTPTPENFRVLFSLGGSEDHLIDRDEDRFADVFPDHESLDAAGFSTQFANDLHAVTMESKKVGIPQNNIAAFRKRLGGRTFGEVQDERNARRGGNPQVEVEG